MRTSQDDAPRDVAQAVATGCGAVLDDARVAGTP